MKRSRPRGRAPRAAVSWLLASCIVLVTWMALAPSTRAAEPELRAAGVRPIEVRAVGAVPEGPPPLGAVERRQLLSLSPLPPPPADPSNRWSDDPRAAALGERLFFDHGLSGDGAHACATCHDPAHGWSNGEPVSDAGIRFPRNVPTLWNVAHNRWFYWDGRADSAWAQALEPLENPREMAGDRVSILRHIHGDQALREAYENLFGALPPLDDRARFPAARAVVDDPEHALHQAWASMAPADRELVDEGFVHVGKALAAFERTLRTPEAPFDRWLRGLRASGSGGSTATSPAASPAAALSSAVLSSAVLSSAALSSAAVRGAKLFVGRGQCTLCHSGPTFSDGEFHDVGIALGANGRIDPGRYGGIVALLKSPFTRAGRFADAAQPTAPVRFLQLRTEQMGQFKTPTLRQLVDTGPYMHDGRFATLTEVVTFYSTREGARPLGHPTSLLQPLDLADGEIADLVAFLESLSAEVPLAAR